MTLKEVIVWVVQAGTLITMSALSAPSLALDSGDKPLELQGEALVEIGPFGLDVYIARLFEGADDERLLELEYVRDVAQKYSHMGWEEGLKSFSDSKYQNSIRWILETTPDVQKGDRLTFETKGDFTSIKLNGVLLEQTDQEHAAMLILAPWVGVTPLDEDVKKKLLGDR
ncbi:chalcone isomerase family protein [Arenicellales bacterium nBUS_48]